MSFSNKKIISKLVQNHFGLDKESYFYFNKELFDPTIDDTYKAILGNSEDLRIRWNIPEETCSNLDEGWKQFKCAFKHFVEHNKVAYNCFRNNKIKIGKNEMKLKKALVKFYTENKYLVASDCFGIDCAGNESVPDLEIEKAIMKELERVGTKKMPVKENLQIVLSLNFADWFLCSTAEEGWDSCLSLDKSTYCYWAGLPGLIGDKNRAMLYVTDGKKKTFEGITTDRFISRTWIVLDKNDCLRIVNFYPNEFLTKDLIAEITGLNITHIMSPSFTSKNAINPLWYTNGYSVFIYQDFHCIDCEWFLQKSGSGFQSFDKNNNFVENDLFYYEKGLKGLISSNTKITDWESGNIYCEVCEDSLHGEYIYRYDGHIYCEYHYNEYVGYCDDCNDNYWREDTYHINSAEREVCESCLSNYPECSECGKRFHIDKLHSIGNELYCENCASKFEECNECGGVFESDELYSHGNELYCESCAKKIEDTTICDTCKEIKDNEDIIFIYSKSENICKVCLDKESEKWQPYLFQELEMRRTA
jgi:hypothetical protein